MPKRPQDELDASVAEDARQGKKPRSASSKMKGNVGKGTPNTDMHKDDDGNDGKRVNISSYNGALMIGIREFYEKDGKMLPGKRFSSVLEVLPQIEAAFERRGVRVPRPEYNTHAAMSSQAQVDRSGHSKDQHHDDLKAVQQPTMASGTLDKSGRRKANHEATDDEDE
nr:putative rna polymerase ii transcriptional coactivator [Quercus suber]